MLDFHKMDAHDRAEILDAIERGVAAGMVAIYKLAPAEFADVCQQGVSEGVREAIRDTRDGPPSEAFSQLLARGIQQGMKESVAAERQ